MINIRAACGSYDRQEMDDVGWMRSADNSADGLTIIGKSLPISRIMGTGKFSTEVQKRIGRSEVPADDKPDGDIVQEKAHDCDTEADL